jgi:hypothetical protein
MKTTIQDYINRHGLTKRYATRETHFIPAMLLPEDDKEAFEIFANDDGTHVVAINTPRKQFKIVHGDLLFLDSGWKDAQINYETDAQAFWNERF